MKPASKFVQLVTTLCLSLFGTALLHAQEKTDTQSSKPLDTSFRPIDAAAVPAEELSSVLQSLADNMRKNVRSAGSAVLKYEFYEEFHFPLGWLEPGQVPTPQNQGDGHWQIYGGEVTLEVADAGKKQHIHYVPTRPWKKRHEKTGEERNAGRLGESHHWIITPDEFLNFDEKSKLGKLSEFPLDKQTESRIVERTHGRGWKYLGRVISFGSLFGGQRGDMWWDLCERDSSSTKGDTESAKVSRRVISITKETDADGHTRFIETKTYSEATLAPKWRADRVPSSTTTTYDSRFGFNPTRYVRNWGSKRSDGKIDRFKTEHQLTYAREGKSFIPAKVVAVEHETKPPEKPRRRRMRILTLVEASLSTKIAPERFTVHSLGLVKGDRMHDKLRQMLFIADGNGGLVEASR